MAVEGGKFPHETSNSCHLTLLMQDVWMVLSFMTNVLKKSRLTVHRGGVCVCVSCAPLPWRLQVAKKTHVTHVDACHSVLRCSPHCLVLFSATHLPETSARLDSHLPQHVQFKFFFETHLALSARYDLADSGRKVTRVFDCVFTRPGREQQSWVKSLRRDRSADRARAVLYWDQLIGQKLCCSQGLFCVVGVDHQALGISYTHTHTLPTYHLLYSSYKLNTDVHTSCEVTAQPAKQTVWFDMGFGILTITSSCRKSLHGERRR